MADYEVKKTPEFTTTARKLETTDRAHADLFNDLYQKLFNNDNYLKEDNDKKVNKKDGDITETQVSVIEESTESFPVPMSGDKTKTLWGKLKKWQQDCLAKFGERLPGETIPAESWNELTYTIEHESIKKGSTVYIGYTFESIPAAQKARIRGKTEQGKLILVAAKAPSTDIEIEEIRVLNE